MKKYLILPTLIVILSTSIFANNKFFQSVRETAKAYRVECSIDDMKLVNNADGSRSFYITLKSNRNNYEMVMLVGYIAAGYAIKTGIEPQTVFVSVDVPSSTDFRVLTMADMKDIKKLTSGKIESSQFARLIQYL